MTNKLRRWIKWLLPVTFLLAWSLRDVFPETTPIAWLLGVLGGICLAEGGGQ